jgi:hypothetical protein
LVFIESRSAVLNPVVVISSIAFASPNQHLLVIPHDAVGRRDPEGLGLFLKLLGKGQAFHFASSPVDKVTKKYQGAACIPNMLYKFAHQFVRPMDVANCDNVPWADIFFVAVHSDF